MPTSAGPPLFSSAAHQTESPLADIFINQTTHSVQRCHLASALLPHLGDCTIAERLRIVKPNLPKRRPNVSDAAISPHAEALALQMHSIDRRCTQVPPPLTEYKGGHIGERRAHYHHCC